MVGLLGAFTLNSIAQTAANTDIKNVASATYSDGTTTYNTVSNEVTVTVAKVGGLTITPDAQTNSSVVAGQTNVPFVFTVTNTGNFTDQVKFLANGGSIRVVGPATVASANVNGTSIAGSNPIVLQSLAQNGAATVTVYLNINAGAAAGASIQVLLGDQTTLSPTFDNDAANNSANEVNTVSTGAVNGSREARGDISTTVDTDALPRVTLTAPAGPVSLGSTITYTTQACNDGLRDLSPVTNGTLNDTQVYIYAPIPAGTTLTNVAGLPAGTEFTTSPLTTAPLAATWTSTAPGTLSTVTRIRIPVGATIAAGTCSSSFTFDVQVTTNNANTPIFEIADVFGENSIGTVVTDQSGDNTPAQGDGNANFDEPKPTDTPTGTQGVQIQTTLAKTGGVLNGTNGFPGAVGPTDNNDDFTNKSVNTGIATVAPGGNTTASGTVVFTNTVQNTGNADDTFTMTAPTVPSGFTVEICTGGTAAAPTSCVDVSSGGSTTIPVAFGSSADYFVRVTEPAGTPVLAGYDTVIRATSTVDNTKTNDTIDRLYTGFLKLDKSFVVDNQTGVGGATDAVPGATIIYTITYTNISTAASGNNVGLTATNVVISEDGNAAPNNWGTYTTRVSGQEFDYTGASGTTAGTGTVNVVSATAYTDTIPSVAPQAVGRFVFKRTIN
jgi:hypothetical protein